MQKFLFALLRVDFMSWLKEMASYQITKNFLSKLFSSVFIDLLFETFKYMEALELILRIWCKYEPIFFFQMAIRLLHLLNSLPLNDNFIGCH